MCLDIEMSINLISGLFSCFFLTGSFLVLKNQKMTIFKGFGQRVFLVLSMGEFNSKTIVLRSKTIEGNPNSGRKIPVSFFTKLWFPSSLPCWSISRRRFRDGEFNGSLTWQISSTISFNCLVESFLGMVLVITEHCLSLKFVLEKRLRGKNILEEERKFILNGYRFADD